MTRASEAGEHNPASEGIEQPDDCSYTAETRKPELPRLVSTTRRLKALSSLMTVLILQKRVTTMMENITMEAPQLEASN
jgi:hypothetical protein